MTVPATRQQVGFVTVVAVVAWLALVLAAFAADPPAGSMEEAIARQVTEAIPADLKMRTVAIGYVDGDGDGRLAHALTGALARLNRFKVIERRDLDKLLEEQGLQARDWTDPGARVKFGRVSGAQGLFIGQVERSEGWLRDAVRSQMKLVHVENGQVLMARDFTTSRWHYGPIAVLAVILLICVGLVVTVASRKREVTQKAALAVVDQRERTINTEELAKAMGEIGRARGVLHEKGFQQAAIRAKDLEVQLRTLRDRIALAPTGQTGRHTAADLRRVVNFDQEYRTLVETVTAGAASLCDRALAGDGTAVDQQLLTITNRVREAEATFRNRGV